jgi:hypothetical protein
MPLFDRIPLSLEQSAVEDMNLMLAAAEEFDRRTNPTDQERGQAILATLKALWTKSLSPASREVMEARFAALNAREVKPKALFDKHAEAVAALWQDATKRAAFIDLAARQRVRVTAGQNGRPFFELETRRFGQTSTFAPLRKDYTLNDDGSITLNPLPA